MTARPEFNFRNPDYVAEFRWRLTLLAQLRADPSMLTAFRRHYADHPADFLDDWGVTFDPRNLNSGRPALVPFRLFPRQREMVDEVFAAWRNREPLLIEKSRDVGASWCMLGLAVGLCVFRQGMTIGFGSRKEEYVDKLGSPKSLFWKARMLIGALPREFRAGWDEKKHGAHMRLSFPETGAVITGEAGDNIGRGDRTSLYVVDEHAHIPRAQLIEASLSATTDCRIDLSSVNGMDNVFAQKRHSGRVKVFVFDWRDDPRKDDEWYRLQCERFDPTVIAQEVDRNYQASVEGVLIPAEWIASAIDAHTKLGFAPRGARRGALDVADEGKDVNAYVSAHGVVVDHLDRWRGKGSDIFETVLRAFLLVDTHGDEWFDYDADGLGAGVRGDARVINANRKAWVDCRAWRGSGAVVNPEKPIPSVATKDLTAEEKRLASTRTNKDFFSNAKAQAWWDLRMRFLRTHRAVMAVSRGAAFDLSEADELISLSSSLPHLSELRVELSRPTWTTSKTGLMTVDKAPDGVPSPNLADAVMMLFAPRPSTRRGFFSHKAKG